MTVRPCEYRAGRANTKICLQRKGFHGLVRAGRLFPNLRVSMNIGVVGGGTQACSGVVVEPNIEKSGSARTVAQNSRNPRQVRCSTVPAGLYCHPHTRTDARTKDPATRADPIREPATIGMASPARGCTVVHVGSGGPSVR
jgi:hypothetical protein